MKTKNLMKVFLACLKETTSKDEARRTIYNRVFHASNVEKLVSTDGHRMTMIALLYDEGLKDKEIDVTHFSSTTGNFPNISPFDPSSNYDQQKCVIVSIAKHHCVSTRKATSIAIYEDGTLSFGPLKDKNLVAVINSAFLKPLIGCDSVEVFYKETDSAFKPLNFCLDNRGYKSWYVVMPLKDEKFNLSNEGV